jgi:3-hydroxymyristoyl/3-hydroxydecanoyl-(acyl carrier protein) dehydratase
LLTLSGDFQKTVNAITETGPGAFSAQCRFPEDFAGFQGHFPDRPILPGVCLIQTAVAALESRLGLPVRLTRVVSAKWLAPVLPDMTLELACEERPAPPGEWALRCVFRHGGNRVAELRLAGVSHWHKSLVIGH